MCNYYLRRNVIRRLILLTVLSSGTLAFGQSTPNIKKSDSTSNPEVINLLNKTQRKSTLLQATATVTNEQLVTTPAPSFLQALPGKIAGLYTRQRSGVQGTDNPESVIDFRVRGQVPLILIDGVPRDFASIEPESIESITILKDALATVMFGQRSSSNIINVTTRRPVASPLKLSFTAQHGLQNFINKTKTLGAANYAILYNEARNNDGLTPVYNAQDIIAYRNGTDPLFHPDNDFNKMFINKASTLDRYNLNIASGNETAKFYVALDYQNEGGFFNTADLNTYSTNSGVNRYIIRSNVDINLNKNLNLALNIFGRIQNANQPGSGTTNVINAITYTPNNAYSIFNPDGSLGGNNNFSNNIYGMLNNAGYTQATSRDLSSDLIITQKLDDILKGLWGRVNVSYTNTIDQSVNRSKSFAVYNLGISTGAPIYAQIGTNTNQPNTLSLSSRRTYTYGKVSLGYDKVFGNHAFNLLALADNQATTINLNLPATYTNFAGNATYNFKEKYFAEGALSYAGHNRFMPGNRYGWFYAAALGADLAKEDFLKDVKWLNTLKPRVSYGKTGKANVGYYVYDQYYESGGTSAAYYFGATPTVARYYQEMALANPNATWEKANKLNVALDVAMFNNKLNVTGMYFNDKHSDLMQNRGNSIQIIGQEYPAENVGKNRYSGFETNLTWRGNTRNLSYFVSGNLSTMQSKVLFQDEVLRPYDYQRRTGLPVLQPFGYIAEGFFQSQDEINTSPTVDGYTPIPGDIRYRDLNGDGVINQFDITAIGTQKPLMFYGLTTGISIKGFDLSVSIQGVANRDIATGAFEYEFQNSGNSQAFEHHLNRWTPTNADKATYPRLSIGTNTNNQSASSFWVHSADYLRIQNVDFGYTLPKRMVERIKLAGVRVFANGFNLYSFDKMKYKDPEGYNSVFPIRRTFNLGFNVKL